MVTSQKCFMEVLGPHTSWLMLVHALCPQNILWDYTLSADAVRIQKLISMSKWMSASV